MVSFSELARKAGRAAGYATHYARKAKETYETGKRLRAYTKKLSKAQIRSQLNKAKKLQEHRQLTKKEKAVKYALLIRLAEKSRHKISHKKKTHRKSKR